MFDLSDSQYEIPGRIAGQVQIRRGHYEHQFARRSQKLNGVVPMEKESIIL